MTTPPPGDGRNQVVDLSVIDTDWGNAISDRTLQSYPDVATRDNLWPQPRPGSMCYTALDDEYWVNRGGVWKIIPAGYIGGKIGPPADYDVSSGVEETVLQYDFPVKLGHHYQVIAYSHGYTAGNTRNVTYGTHMTDDQGSGQWVTYQSILVPNETLLGTSTFIYTPTSTKMAWVRMNGSIAGTGQRFRLFANVQTIQVHDVGGP